jgi:hypothetical protein
MGNGGGNYIRGGGPALGVARIAVAGIASIQEARRRRATRDAASAPL